MTQFYYAFATALYVGKFPFAPGTVGSAFGLALWYGIAFLSLGVQLAIILAVTVIGTLATHHLQKVRNLEDPGWIVVDEVVGMWLTLIFLPQTWGYWIAAFFMFRLFDIWKPGVIDKSQELPHGIGVMADDVLAGLLSGILLLIFALVF